MGSIVLNEKECLEQFNQKHCVALLGARVVITHEEYDPTLGRTRTVYLKVDDLKKLYANVLVSVARGKDTVPAAEWWLEHKDRRQARGIVFDPQGDSDGYFNLWKGFSVTPKEKDCQRFLAFIHDVICGGDEELYRFFIGFCAHLVQRPWELPGTALILVGEQGTGKSFVFSQIARLVAEHAAMVSQRRQVIGGFNAHLANIVLLIADEVSIATRFATNAIKAPVTEGFLMLEAKGHDPVPIRNCIRYVFLTNDPHAVIMGSKERRFCVYDVGNQRQQDHQFFKELADYMDNGGLEGLMHHLMTFDLSQFEIRKVPRSKEFARQVEQSFSDVERYWYERLLAGELPAEKPWPKEIEKAKLTYDYQVFCDAVGVRKRSAETTLGRNLKKMCPGIGETRPGGKRHFILPSLEECRKAFNSYTNIEWDWEE